MRKYWFFLLLYFVGIVMALAFLLPLRLHGGAIFAVQWWPVLISGFFLVAAFCLEPIHAMEKKIPLKLRDKYYFMHGLPNDLVLKTSALIGFGLSPFWCWTNSAASLSLRLDSYFTGMLFLSTAAMFVMLVSFTRHLRVIAVCIGGSDGLVRRLNVAVRGWLYFFLVPLSAIVVGLFAIAAGSGRAWFELLEQQPDLSCGMVVQMVKNQIITISLSWIGTEVVWLVFILLVWELAVAFELLLQFNRYLNEQELQGVMMPPAPAAEGGSVADETEKVVSAEGKPVSVSTKDTDNHE